MEFASTRGTCHGYFVDRCSDHAASQRMQQDMLMRAWDPIGSRMPGGGIAPDGSRWISSRPAFVLPVRVLANLFRRLFLTRLVALHDAGRLAFFGSAAHLADHQAFLRHLKRRSTGCYVHVAVAPVVTHTNPVGSNATGSATWPGSRFHDMPNAGFATSAGTPEAQIPIGNRPRPAGSCMRDFRTPDATRNASPSQSLLRTSPSPKSGHCRGLRCRSRLLHLLLFTALDDLS